MNAHTYLYYTNIYYDLKGTYLFNGYPFDEKYQKQMLWLENKISTLEAAA